MRPHFTTLVDTGTLAAHLDDPGWVVVDCRFVLSDPDEGHTTYLAGHLPGARYAHLERDLSGPVDCAGGRHPLPAAPALARQLSAWGVGAQTQVAAYDDGFGSIAARLWWLLRWLGHERVALLDGGLPKWRREGRPTTRMLPTPREPGGFVTRCNDMLVANADEVERARKNPAALLLDARPEERFLGLVEPFDRIAGHIPGSINRPWEDNLAFSGEFQSAAGLREEYAGVLDGRDPARVIHLCGSGVTACHSVLAMEHAGFAGSRLYPGSWSEWIRDPARPVAEAA